MPIEIERKFLVAVDLDGGVAGSPATAAWAIRQGYVTRPGDDPEVRVRHARPVQPAGALRERPDAAGGPVVRQLTTKATIPGGTDGGVARREVEVDVDQAQFDELWEVTEGRRIEKVRTEHVLRDAAGVDRPFTVDHFGGALRGLVLGEIEFGDEASSAAFEPPAAFAVEVTHDRRYRNSALAGAAGPPDAGAGASPTAR